MTLDPLGYPWRGDGRMSHKKQQELLRRARKPLRVDDTMTMRETSGGIVLGVKPAKGVAAGTARWFRIISDAELSNCIPSEENELRCRETQGCGKDDSPSLYGRWVDFNSTSCTLSDKDSDCTIIYFPGRFIQCQATTEPDTSCSSNKWIGMLVQAFWNAEAERWESDSTPIEDFDQVDFVYFCNLDPVTLCGGGGCPDEDTPSNELNCCLFDGLVRRDTGPRGESCSYECGARNKAFDVWILCTNKDSLPAGQTCFAARRIDDAYAVSYCPLGPDGPVVTETRPVYSIGCCGCGCPDDEVYLEWFYTRIDPVTGRELIPCEQNGMRITAALKPDAPQEGDTEFDRRYIGYFCLTYEIPVYLVMVEDPADVEGDPAQQVSIFVKPDCETGQLVTQYRDHAEMTGVGSGCCYTPVTGWSADPQFKTGQVDVLKRYISGGDGVDPQVCEDEWQNCRFCYRIRMHCEGGTMSDIDIAVVLPPGHPFYAGTPQEDPDGPMENLEVVGDAATLVAEPASCDGRQWYTMTLNGFGLVDPITMLDPSVQDTLYGWPHYENHVFGGCCWDHVALGGFCTPGVTNNICDCLPISGGAYDICIQTPDYQSPRVLMKASWNCLNEPF